MRGRAGARIWPRPRICDPPRHLVPRRPVAGERSGPRRSGDQPAREELAISVHVSCELLAGAALSERPDREREAVYELCAAFRTTFPDERFAPTYARLLAELEREGRRPPLMDLLIATTAVVDRAPLVTRDEGGFGRIPDLEVRAY